MTKAYYTITVKDSKGRDLRCRRYRSHSYVKGLTELLAALGGASTKTIQDTGGTSRTLDQSKGYALQLTSGAGSAAQGIVYGTGTTAVTISDYALATLIATGGGAGQLNYLACTLTDEAVAGSRSSFTVDRSAVNNSGDTIVVKEIGIYARFQEAAANRYAMIVRDVLGTTQSVPDGGSITVSYTVYVEV